jgi:hypothetical protein
VTASLLDECLTIPLHLSKTPGARHILKMFGLPSLLSCQSNDLHVLLLMF